MTKKQKIQIIKDRFLDKYKDSKSELKWRNTYELLISVMLSAQCTDKRVNLVTPQLFSEFPDAKALANADISRIKELLKSVSFFNNKSKNIIKMAQMLLDRYDGEVPLNQDELKNLAGVGQKTANVVLIESENANFMAVDTHVFRTSHRLGLSKAKTAIECEIDLNKIFKDDLGALHQAFVLFGRYTCKAIKPMCDECFVAEFCVNKGSFKPK